MKNTYVQFIEISLFNFNYISMNREVSYSSEVIEMSLY